MSYLSISNSSNREELPPLFVLEEKEASLHAKVAWLVIPLFIIISAFAVAIASPISLYGSVVVVGLTVIATSLLLLKLDADSKKKQEDPSHTIIKKKIEHLQEGPCHKATTMREYEKHIVRDKNIIYSCFLGSSLIDYFLNRENPSDSENEFITDFDRGMAFLFKNAAPTALNSEDHRVLRDEIQIITENKDKTMEIMRCVENPDIKSVHAKIQSIDPENFELLRKLYDAFAIRSVKKYFTIDNRKIYSFCSQTLLSKIWESVELQYANQDLLITVAAYGPDPFGHTKFHLFQTTREEWILEARTLFKINFHGARNPLYIQGKITLNLNQGDAVLSWNSPIEG